MQAAELGIGEWAGAAVWRLGKQFHRSRYPPGAVRRAYQTLEAYGSAVRKAENRLEMAGQSEFNGQAASTLDDEHLGIRWSRVHSVHDCLCWLTLFQYL